MGQVKIGAVSCMCCLLRLLQCCRALSVPVHTGHPVPQPCAGILRCRFSNRFFYTAPARSEFFLAGADAVRILLSYDLPFQRTGKSTVLLFPIFIDNICRGFYFATHQKDGADGKSTIFQQFHLFILLFFLISMRCCQRSAKDYCFICSSCLIIIFFTISPPIEPASRDVRSPL